MRIRFTQYLRPDGRRKTVWIERDGESADAAMALLEAGCWFDVEELTTGEASMTVERFDDDGETELLAQEVCENAPGAPELAVDRLMVAALRELRERVGS